MTERFREFCRAREQAAIRATLPPYKTVEVDEQLARMSAIGNAWSRAHFDGDFYRSARPFAGDLPRVNLVFVESRDGGKSWSHIWTMPAETGLCEESDFAELDNGDLLFVHRAEHYNGQNYLGSDRLQNLFRRNGEKWDVQPVEKAPFPHSGFPELLKTRDGMILHIATDGAWQTADGGTHWSKLDVPGSPYYPQARQLKDGRILVVGHVGGDDEYGKVDQTIVQQTFRITPINDKPVQ